MENNQENNQEKIEPPKPLNEVIDYLSMYSEDQQKQVLDTVKIGLSLDKNLKPMPMTNEEIRLEANKIITEISRFGIKDFGTDEKGRKKSQRLNAYTDMKGTVLITIDIHEGATPLTIRHPSNNKILKSLCYLVPQNLTPEAEWYKPLTDEISEMGKDLAKYCLNGGLVLRKIGTKEGVSIKKTIKNMTNTNAQKNKLVIELVDFLISKGGEIDELSEKRNVVFQDIDKDAGVFLAYEFTIKQGKVFVDIYACDPNVEEDESVCKNEVVESLEQFKKELYCYKEAKISYDSHKKDKISTETKPKKTKKKVSKTL